MTAKPAKKGKPRYLELADDLREKIMRGDFPGPAQFPTENLLCERYSVSRFTVREALRTLQGEGLIQRRRGSGTVVQPAAARGGALHQPLSNVAEILQYAHNTSFDFARENPANLPKRMAEQIGLEVAGKWARFRGIRKRNDDGRPIAVTEAYVHPDLVQAADAVDTEGETIFRQLERLSGFRIAQVTQDIQAVAAPANIARSLGIPRRSPCLRILRCYYDGDRRMVEISASHHPGNRFAYAMHIEVEN